MPTVSRPSTCAANTASVSGRKSRGERRFDRRTPPMSVPSTGSWTARSRRRRPTSTGLTRMSKWVWTIWRPHELTGQRFVVEGSVRYAVAGDTSSRVEQAWTAVVDGGPPRTRSPRRLGMPRRRGGRRHTQSLHARAHGWTDPDLACRCDGRSGTSSPRLTRARRRSPGTPLLRTPVAFRWTRCRPRRRSTPPLPRRCRRAPH
jgi:hypothetical protein